MPRLTLIHDPIIARDMNALLARNWWAVALRGVAALALGIIAVVLPGVTLATLMLLMAVYFLADGVMAIIGAIYRGTHHQRWWPLILEGILDLAAAAVAIGWPLATALAIVILVAAWALVTGFAALAAAVSLHRSHGRWLLAANGILSVLLGLAMIFWPAAGVLTLLWLIAIYAIISGLISLALAFRLRSHSGLRASSGDGTAAARL